MDSKKGIEANCSLTSNEIALLSPTATRVVQKFNRLSATGRATVLELILLTVLDEHGIDDPLNLLELLFGESVEDQEQITYDGLLTKQSA